MSLSAKFAKLKGTARPASASNKGRILQNISSQQAKRSVQQNQRRSLNLTSGSQNDKKKKPTLNLIQKSLRKKGDKKGKGGIKKGKKLNRKDKKEAPTSVNELDVEMDKYWFAAGKGPDPVKKSLDDEMDEYFKGKIAKANTESA